MDRHEWRQIVKREVELVNERDELQRRSKRMTESADVKVGRWPLRLLCTASTLGVSLWL